MLSRISFFNIVMVMISTVASTRNISSSYSFGASLFFYYFIVCLLFFIPTSLIVSKFAAKYRNDNGVYHWVSRAFGWRIASLAIWLQWLENIFYYPLSLMFIANSVLQLFAVEFDPYLLVIITNVLFWALTYINMQGINYATFWIEKATLLGLIVPIFVLACAALLSNDFVPISISVPVLSIQNIRDPILITMASFLGMEVAAVHNDENINNMPLAVLLSSFFVISSIVGGSWLMMGWIGHSDVNVANALAYALTKSLDSLGYSYFNALLVLLLLLGPLGGITAWIISPIKSLHFTICEIYGQEKFSINGLLLLQGLLVTFTSFLYFKFDVNGVFILVTDAMVSLYLIMYLIMFAAALVLLADSDLLFSKGLTKVCCVLGILSSILGIMMCLWQKNATLCTYAVLLIFFFCSVVIPYYYLKCINK